MVHTFLMCPILRLKHLVKVDIKQLAAYWHFDFVKWIFEYVISVNFVDCAQRYVQVGV